MNWTLNSFCPERVHLELQIKQRLGCQLFLR
uniref:Uncharacterized protein n=1 Tax=Anguilla anguilla TaxID=7936 RepID=A0A0E9R9I0_ANGAN